MRELRPYERLSAVYDDGWGAFALKYVGLVQELLRERGVRHARFLDLACGTGCFALELARLGHTVVGIDSSAEMIAVARSKARGLPRLLFDVQDMSDFTAVGRFHAVVCTYDSINYLMTLEDIGRMFRRVAAVLEGHGIFLFDSNTDRHYARYHNGAFDREIRGVCFRQSLSYDTATGVARTTFDFSDGTREVHTQRAYDLPDLQPLLVGAGIGVRETYEGFDKRPYGPNCDRLICLAEKPATEQ